MPKHLSQLSCFSLLFLLCNPGHAQSDVSGLHKNPFSQPDALKAPTQRVLVEPGNQSETPLIIDFILSATLISVNEPMAVVNGELLTMGEETNGMRLILVDEGRAVISYAGKQYDLSINDGESQPPPQKMRR
jgi:hypothetical protein